MCHVSYVRCHVSHVTCHIHKSDKKIYIYILFGQSGWASLWRVCYQRGLPRLVSLNQPIGWCSLLVAMSVTQRCCTIPMPFFKGFLQSAILPGNCGFFFVPFRPIETHLDSFKPVFIRFHQFHPFKLVLPIFTHLIGIDDTICTHPEIQCLLYTFFFIFYLWSLILIYSARV